MVSIQQIDKIHSASLTFGLPIKPISIKYLKSVLKMVHFFKRLEERVNHSDSLLCIGLDPHSSQISDFSPISVLKFCQDIVESTSQFAAAYKPNSAFFEALGPEGLEILKQVISLIPRDIPVILDNKRGDIDTTAQAYASASYEVYKADAVTLSPYMGWDSIFPFVTGNYDDKAAFILCKTSNKSSKEFQDVNLITGELLYEKVAVKSLEWSTLTKNNNIGLVVGAADIPALKKIRTIVPSSWILCPGVGAQGGDAKSVCEAGLRDDGSGLLINVSRAISQASDKTATAKAIRDEINECRALKLLSADLPNNKKQKGDHGSRNEMVALERYQQEFIEFAIQKNVLQFGSFKLKSGRSSPYFFNAGLFSCGHSLHILGRVYAMVIKKASLHFDVIFGPAYKGICLAAAVSTAWYQLYGESKDFSYNRKEAKDHGEGGVLVGASMTERRVLIVDDVITAGTAIRESMVILQSVKAQLVGVIVCLDRQEKTSETIHRSAIQQVEEDNGVPVLSVIQLKHLVAHIESTTSKITDGHDDNDLLSKIRLYRETYGVMY